MRWSARLGTFAGIDVYVHVTFLALIAYFAAVYWGRTGTLEGVLAGLAMILMLFACILLHEYGHALTARRFGVRTRHITLLPIGGLAVLEGMPRNPRQEIAIALAGPAVNLAIAAGAYALIAVSGGAGALLGVEPARMGLARSLVAANLALALFNLLPAFPMDGGRVLRALLSLRMGRVRATRAAAVIGRILAVGLGLLGLTGNPFLLLIAVFVWTGAGAEARAVAAVARREPEPAAGAMITRFHALAPENTLADAVEIARAGSQTDFPVLEGGFDGRVVGMLTEAAIGRGLREIGPNGLVAQAMQPARTADIDVSLDTLLRDGEAAEVRLVCILQRGRLVGLLDLDKLADLMAGRPASASR